MTLGDVLRWAAFFFLTGGVRFFGRPSCSSPISLPLPSYLNQSLFCQNRHSPFDHNFSLVKLTSTKINLHQKMYSSLLSLSLSVSPPLTPSNVKPNSVLTYPYQKQVLSNATVKEAQLCNPTAGSSLPALGLLGPAKNPTAVAVGFCCCFFSVRLPDLAKYRCSKHSRQKSKDQNGI